MLKYPNNKQTMFFQKALIMVLSLCLILPLLAGCSGSSDIDYENFKKVVRTERPRGIPESVIDYNAPKIDGNTKTDWTSDESEVYTVGSSFKLGNKSFTIRNVNIYTEGRTYHGYKGSFYSLNCINDDSHVCIHIYDNAEKPFLIDHYDVNHTKTPGVDLATAKEKVMHYIENTLNKDFQLGIDLSVYNEYDEYSYGPDNPEMWLDEHYGKLFVWRQRVNGFTVRFLQINTNSYGEIYSCRISSTPNKEIVDQIPNYSEEDYIEASTKVLKEWYANAESDVVISNVHILSGRKYYFNEVPGYALQPHDNYLFYDNFNNRFELVYRLQWDVEASDGRTENGAITVFYLPLDF